MPFRMNQSSFQSPGQYKLPHMLLGTSIHKPITTTITPRTAFPMLTILIYKGSLYINLQLEDLEVDVRWDTINI